MYNLPSINVNPREWIKVNIYRGVNNYKVTFWSNIQILTFIYISNCEESLWENTIHQIANPIKTLFNIKFTIPNATGGGICNHSMAPWFTPLKFHINLVRAPNIYATGLGFSIHVCINKNSTLTSQAIIFWLVDDYVRHWPYLPHSSTRKNYYKHKNMHIST